MKTNEVIHFQNSCSVRMGRAAQERKKNPERKSALEALIIDETEFRSVYCILFVSLVGGSLYMRFQHAVRLSESVYLSVIV